ncbi:MAG: shikimate kinase [Alphaproteobacteria bacterium]|nr:shikimate kinase [Alphaproteobacteria bacterium]MBU0796742.1 shikimate kinase [Alphaproteobacteria bacterium]MBU0889042.1 shikimate kinase [Alphaproteobacteria bacterium]MBU1814062.1 shikimate kinase [Alphaproteobacteria bacterium]MBU2089542.1 shikimate kinase [Alphaproteobacteria bacterium]
MTVPSHNASRTIALVGLMGAGKSAVGRRLASRLGLPFVDADIAIEEAAGCSIEEIFARHGEAEFRDGERRVIQRLVEQQPPHILATGGGAFINERTRERLKDHAITVWLKADLETLLERVGKRNNRPLLKQGDPAEVLRTLMGVRYPIYAEADITVETSAGPVEETVERVLAALEAYRADKTSSNQRVSAS